MQGKPKTTITAEWITVDDVSEEKCLAETIEEFTTPENLQKVFEYRCNKHLHKTAMSIGQRMMSKEESGFVVWNDE